MVTTEEPGRKIHREAVKFFQINKSGFCGTCHDVTLVNNFRLEEAARRLQFSSLIPDGGEGWSRHGDWKKHNIEA